MEEYNRDGPQEASPSWMGIIFWMVAGFLIGGLPCLTAAVVLLIGRGDPYVMFVLLAIAPLAAMSGGVIGMWLAWKQLKRPLL